MKRTVIREHIFKILFSVEFHNTEEFEEQVHMYCENLNVDPDISISFDELIYIEEKSKAIADKLAQIDAKIDSVSEGWPTTRLGKAELSIMRLAVYEMFFDDDIPVGIAMNEAIELAKQYGSDESTSKFVNGVLSKMI